MWSYILLGIAALLFIGFFQSKQRVKRQSNIEQYFGGSILGDSTEYKEFFSNLTVPTITGELVSQKIARSFGHSTMLLLRDNPIEAQQFVAKLNSSKCTPARLASMSDVSACVSDLGLG